jgi:predicted  nucleic acid-binding Zn-ribbon protein
MSILRENLNILLELQQADSERDKVARQRTALDSGGKLTQNLVIAQTEYDQAQAVASKTHGALKDAELELAGIERKIKDYEQKMRQGTVTNTREVMNFEKEFNQLNRQRAQLDDKILTLMEQSDVHSASANAAENKVSDIERDLATVKSRFHDELTKLDSQSLRLNVKRGELSKLVGDPNLLKRYETLRTKSGSGGIAIARTIENTCGACHMQIGTIAVSQASIGDQLAICENCGRIMA